MSRPRIVRARDGRVAVERFRLGRRLEHLLIIASFTTLLLTGFPQKFADGSVSHWVVALFGGLDNTRLVHRVAGVVFPLDKSMFTGFVSARHLRHHHRLEYERLFGDAPLEVVEAPPGPARPTPPGAGGDTSGGQTEDQ